MVWFADITVENRPMVVSNWTVPEASGNFCQRGGRFGAHSSNESMAPVFYKKLAFIAFFNAGVRALDMRDPYPAEGGRLFHPADHRGDRQALRQGRRQGPLQGRDPDQQCRDRRPRLHLHRRSRQHRHAHPRADRRGARASPACREGEMRNWPAISVAVLALGAVVGRRGLREPRRARTGGKSPGRSRATAGPRAAPSAARVPRAAARSRSMCGPRSASAIAIPASPMTTKSIASPIST